jgi:beta-phosphoglucomutase-like phosphatase (HAD superfamily)
MRALIFDCDGVLAETEGDLHLPAFNRALLEFGFDLEWTRADYADRLLTGGGKERIAGLLTPEFVAARRLPTDPSQQRALVAAVHARKTELLGELLATLDPTTSEMRRGAITAVVTIDVRAAASVGDEQRGGRR